MKVITEEKLRELWTQYLTHHMLDVDFEEIMLNECQELDTLTVTRLRPMSEAPYKEEILIYNHGEFIKATIYPETNMFAHWLYRAKGWIPMPRYEPEEQQ